MKKILLNSIITASLFASNTNTKIEKDINTIAKSNIKKTINNQNLTQKHFKYVLNYQDFLKKLSHKKLDTKKPILLVIGTPDCKWTKKRTRQTAGSNVYLLVNAVLCDIRCYD